MPVRRPGRALAIVALVLVAVAAWIGVRGLLAQRSLEQARASLASAPQALLDRRLDDARTAIDVAGASTSRARDLTSDPVWRLAAAVPVLGSSLATARGVATAADDVARGVLPAALAGAEGLDPAALRRPDGSVDVALLRTATPSLLASAQRTADVRTALEALPVDRSVGPVAAGHAEVLDSLVQLDSVVGGAADALEIAPALLGEDRPRRFFVMVQQAAESRGTGGIIGGFAVLETSGGRLSLVARGSNADLRQGYVPPAPGTPEDYIRRYEPFGAFSVWQQVNYSPDLPVVARNVAARWAAQGGAPVDGVVALDATALELLLRGAGPIDLGGGRQLPPDQIERYLSLGQYEGVQLTAEGIADRKDQLSDVAESAVDRLTSGGGDSVELLRGLVDAVQSGHLRMASDDPALQPVLARTGLDGALPGGPQPTAQLVLANATAGKLDQFLDRSVHYELGPCQGDRRTSTVRVGLRSAPPPDLPPYVTFRVDAPDGQSRTNLVRVSLHGTSGAKVRSVTLDGQPVSALAGRTPVRLELGEEGGRPVWTLPVELPPDQQREIVMVVDEPVAEGPVRLPEQPLVQPLDATGSSNGC